MSQTIKSGREIQAYVIEFKRLFNTPTPRFYLNGANPAFECSFAAAKTATDAVKKLF